MIDGMSITFSNTKTTLVTVPVPVKLAIVIKNMFPKLAFDNLWDKTNLTSIKLIVRETQF